MSKLTADIEDMLDFLDLSHMKALLLGLVASGEVANKTPLELLRELVLEEYTAEHGKTFESLLKKSGLKGCDASVDSLVSSLERRYNTSQIELLRTLEFLENGRNLYILGPSGIGKTYLAKAFGVQACFNAYRTLFVDTADLLEELYYLKVYDAQHKTDRFRKKKTYYSNMQVLILDDFLMSSPDEQGRQDLFSLIKKRAEKERTTIVCSQREPDAWIKVLRDPGNAESTVRRITDNGILVEIVPH